MENTIPTDSVLRRHYDATQQKTSQTKTSQSGGGFMCWLKKLLGG